MQLKSIFSFDLHNCPMKVYSMITTLRKKILGFFAVEWLTQNRLVSDGNSLAVQWLGLGAFTTKSPGVQSQVGEQSRKLSGVTKQQQNRLASEK